MVSTKEKTEFEDVAAWLKKRFWYLSLFLLAFNLVAGSLAFPLMTYMSREYIASLLQSQQNTVDDAKAKAEASRQDAQTALEKASEARGNAQGIETDLAKLKQRLADVDEAIQQYQKHATQDLPKLIAEINMAKATLGEYEQIVASVKSVQDGMASLQKKMDDDPLNVLRGNFNNQPLINVGTTASGEKYIQVYNLHAMADLTVGGNMLYREESRKGAQEEMLDNRK